MPLSNLELETKQSKSPLMASIYGLVAAEVNLIRDTINDIIAAVNGLDPVSNTEALAHKVDVSESQSFTDNERTQGRENIGAAFRKLYSADILSADLDAMLTSGFYEGTFTAGQEVNAQAVLRLLVFAKSTTSCTQVQFSTTTKVWIRQGVYADSTWTWSTWTVIADDLLANYLSVEPQEFSGEQISQLLTNLNILSDVKGYTYRGFEYPTGIPIPKVETGKAFYFANMMGTYAQFNLQINDPGLYIISNTGIPNVWTKSPIVQSLISFSVGDLQTAASNGQLTPGQLYKITNHGNDNGILVQAASTTTLFPNGIRLGIVPIIYIPGTYTFSGFPRISHGVWNPTLLYTVASGDLVVYCGKVYQNNTGYIGTASNWDLDAVNWTLVPVGHTDVYTGKVFSCIYSLDNNYISKQWDDKGNEFGEAIPPADNFLVEYNDWNLAGTLGQFCGNKLKRCYNNINFGALSIRDNTNGGQIYNCVGGVDNDLIGYNEIGPDGKIEGINVTGGGYVYDNLIEGSLSSCGFSDTFRYNTIKEAVTYSNKSLITNDGPVEHLVICFSNTTTEDISSTTYIREDLIPRVDNTIPLGTVNRQFSAVYTTVLSSTRVKTDTLTEEDFHVETGDAKTLVLDTPVWNDIYVPIATGPQPASDAPTWTAFTANTSAYTFAIDNYKDMGTVEIPHCYKEGTDLEIHLHVANQGVDTTERKCLYQIYYTYGIPDDGSHQFTDEVTLSGTLTIPANTPTRSAFYVSMGTITGTNIKIGTQLKMRVIRGATPIGGTAPTNNPYLGQVGVHHQTDTMGSRQISTK